MRRVVSWPGRRVGEPLDAEPPRSRAGWLLSFPSAQLSLPWPCLPGGGQAGGPAVTGPSGAAFESRELQERDAELAVGRRSGVRRDSGSREGTGEPGAEGGGAGQEGGGKGCVGAESKAVGFLFLEKSEVRCRSCVWMGRVPESGRGGGRRALGAAMWTWELARLWGECLCVSVFVRWVLVWTCE